MFGESIGGSKADLQAMNDNFVDSPHTKEDEPWHEKTYKICALSTDADLQGNPLCLIRQKSN